MSTPDPGACPTRHAPRSLLRRTFALVEPSDDCLFPLVSPVCAPDMPQSVFRLWSVLEASVPGRFRARPGPSRNPSGSLGPRDLPMSRSPARAAGATLPSPPGCCSICWPTMTTGSSRCRAPRAGPSVRCSPGTGCTGAGQPRRSLLEGFWRANSASTVERAAGQRWLVGLARLEGRVALPMVSPYAYPEVARAAVTDLLGRQVDFDAVALLQQPPTDRRPPLLLVGAVDVATGAHRAFSSWRGDITLNAILASAAVPPLFRAVHEDGSYYWDGLFSQNPPVRELPDADPEEIWVIRINPLARAREPTAIADIADRRNELSGNLSLEQELYFISKVNQWAGRLDGRYRHIEVRANRPRPRPRPGQQARSPRRVHHRAPARRSAEGRAIPFRATLARSVPRRAQVSAAQGSRSLLTTAVSGYARVGSRRTDPHRHNPVGPELRSRADPFLGRRGVLGRTVSRRTPVVGHDLGPAIRLCRLPFERLWPVDPEPVGQVLKRCERNWVVGA